MLKLKLLIHPRFIRDLFPNSTKLRDSHQKTPSNPFSPGFFLCRKIPNRQSACPFQGFFRSGKPFKFPKNPPVDEPKRKTRRPYGVVRPVPYSSAWCLGGGEVKPWGKFERTPKTKQKYEKKSSVCFYCMHLDWCFFGVHAWLSQSTWLVVHETH